jgi:hypothetical protein
LVDFDYEGRSSVALELTEPEKGRADRAAARHDRSRPLPAVAADQAAALQPRRIRSTLAIPSPAPTPKSRSSRRSRRTGGDEQSSGAVTLGPACFPCLERWRRPAGRRRSNHLVRRSHTDPTGINRRWDDVIYHLDLLSLEPEYQQAADNGQLTLRQAYELFRLDPAFRPRVFEGFKIGWSAKMVR